MKKWWVVVGIFVFTAIVYFGISNRWTFSAKWYLDYFNPLAVSLRSGRVDIDPPGDSYDLVHFGDRWYLPWGVLPAVLLVPFQLIKGGFVPTIYLSVFFGAINTVLVYLMLVRLRHEFFPGMKWHVICLYTVLFAFGTMNFYVGTLGSVWHVDQIVTSFFGNLAVLVIFKKNRSDRDYALSALLLAFALAGRGTIVLLCVIPAILFAWDYGVLRKYSLIAFVRKGMFLFGIPAFLGVVWFFTYNFFRFGNIFEYGYNFIVESPYLEQVRKTHGIMSVAHLPTNLWYMLAEIPFLRWGHGVELGINLKGNSLLFLTPPFLAALLAKPVAKKGKTVRIDPYITALWVGVVVTLIPSLLIYSTGWMQFGFRYALDVMAPLVLLVVFGMKGRVNMLMVLGTAWAVWMHVMGITALM